MEIRNQAIDAGRGFDWGRTSELLDTAPETFVIKHYAAMLELKRKQIHGTAKAIISS